MLVESIQLVGWKISLGSIRAGGGWRPAGEAGAEGRLLVAQAGELGAVIQQAFEFGRRDL